MNLKNLPLTPWDSMDPRLRTSDLDRLIAMDYEKKSYKNIKDYCIYNRLQNKYPFYYTLYASVTALGLSRKSAFMHFESYT